MAKVIQNSSSKTLKQGGTTQSTPMRKLAARGLQKAQEGYPGITPPAVPKRSDFNYDKYKKRQDYINSSPTVQQAYNQWDPLDESFGSTPWDIHSGQPEPGIQPAYPELLAFPAARGMGKLGNFVADAVTGSARTPQVNKALGNKLALLNSFGPINNHQLVDDALHASPGGMKDQAWHDWINTNRVQAVHGEQPLIKDLPAAQQYAQYDPFMREKVTRVKPFSPEKQPGTGIAQYNHRTGKVTGQRELPPFIRQMRMKQEAGMAEPAANINPKDLILPHSRFPYDYLPHKKGGSVYQTGGQGDHLSVFPMMNHGGQPYFDCGGSHQTGGSTDDQFPKDIPTQRKNDFLEWLRETSFDKIKSEMNENPLMLEGEDFARFKKGGYCAEGGPYSPDVVTDPNQLLAMGYSPAGADASNQSFIADPQGFSYARTNTPKTSLQPPAQPFPTELTREYVMKDGKPYMYFNNSKNSNSWDLRPITQRTYDLGTKRTGGELPKAQDGYPGRPTDREEWIRTHGSMINSGAPAPAQPYIGPPLANFPIDNGTPTNWVNNPYGATTDWDFMAANDAQMAANKPMVPFSGQESPVDHDGGPRKKKRKSWMDSPWANPDLWNVGLELGTNIANSLDRRKQNQWMTQQTAADSWNTAVKGSRGEYTQNNGYFRPDQTVPVQFPGAAGFYHAQEGGQINDGEYDLSEQEISDLRNQGYQIDLLD